MERAAKKNGTILGRKMHALHVLDRLLRGIKSAADDKDCNPYRILMCVPPLGGRGGVQPRASHVKTPSSFGFSALTLYYELC